MSGAGGPQDVRRRLADPDLAAYVRGLGFRDDDRDDLLAAVTTVLERDEDLRTVAALAGGLGERVGDLDGSTADDVWSALPPETGGTPPGVLALLALLVTAPDVAAFHERRAVPAGVSAATLADLGQQVAVHRLTYGGFGLHTYGWLRLVWSGALYRLGRLQFNLQPVPGGDRWVLSTHIPATGPLSPTGVDASVRAARDFFPRHFPDYPATDIVCSSWLLDPVLPELLPSSNLAAFQRRWDLDGPAQPGDADVLFFVFHRRGPVEVASLPTDTSLRRAVRERLLTGAGWSVRTGRLAR